MPNGTDPTSPPTPDLSDDEILRLIVERVGQAPPAPAIPPERTTGQKVALAIASALNPAFGAQLVPQIIAEQQARRDAQRNFDLQSRENEINALTTLLSVRGQLAQRSRAEAEEARQKVEFERGGTRLGIEEAREARSVEERDARRNALLGAAQGRIKSSTLLRRQAQAIIGRLGGAFSPSDRSVIESQFSEHDALVLRIQQDIADGTVDDPTAFEDLDAARAQVLASIRDIEEREAGLSRERRAEAKTERQRREDVALGRLDKLKTEAIVLDQVLQESAQVGIFFKREAVGGDLVSDPFSTAKPPRKIPRSRLQALLDSKVASIRAIAKEIGRDPDEVLAEAGIEGEPANEIDAAADEALRKLRGR